MTTKDLYRIYDVVEGLINVFGASRRFIRGCQKRAERINARIYKQFNVVALCRACPHEEFGQKIDLSIDKFKKWIIENHEFPKK